MELIINNEVKDSILEFIAYDVIKDLGLNKLDINVELNIIREKAYDKYFYLNPFMPVGIAGITNRPYSDKSNFLVVVSVNDMYKEYEDFLLKKHRLKSIEDFIYIIVSHELRHVWQHATGNYSPLTAEDDANQYSTSYVLRNVA